MKVKLSNSLESCWSVLRFLGLVFDEHDRKVKWRPRRIIGFTLMMVLLMPLGTGLLYGVTKAKNFIQFCGNIGHFCFFLFNATKTWNVFIRCERLLKIQQKISKIEQSMCKDEKHKNLNHLKDRLEFATKHYEKSKNTAICMSWLTLILTIIYGKFPIDVFKGLFDAGSTEAYTSSVYLCVSCVHGAFAVMNVNILPIIILSYGIGLLDELAARLKCFGTSKEFDYEELKKCIEIHQMIKNFIHEVNDCFRLMFYLQNIFSRLIICIFAFNLVYTKNHDELALSIAFATISIFEILVNC